MIQASVRIVAAVGKREEVLHVLRCLTGPTEVSKGCRGCQILVDADHADAITYCVQWDNREELDEHFRSERFRRLLPYIEMSEVPPEVDVSSMERIGGMEILVAAIGLKSSQSEDGL